MSTFYFLTSRWRLTFYLRMYAEVIAIEAHPKEDYEKYVFS